MFHIHQEEFDALYDMYIVSQKKTTTTNKQTNKQELQELASTFTRMNGNASRAHNIGKAAT